VRGKRTRQAAIWYRGRPTHAEETFVAELLKSIKATWASIPEGNASLFFIQIFATLGFAVLQSTLVLYATKHLHFSAKEATALIGVFGAFNYGLHLFGGYLGGRFLSNRNLFVGGMVLQVIGCGLIAAGTTPLFYWGLALFLTGSGLNVTCINMMLTQRFAPEDPRREGAFLWNYAGMNFGFFIGFYVAGHFQKTESYAQLFTFATLGNFVSIIVAALTWKTISDLNTPLRTAATQAFRRRFLAGVAILVGLVPVVWFLLQRDWTKYVMYGIGILVGVALVLLTVFHPDRRERRNMTAYLVLTLGSLVFWSLYLMAPSGLQLFADHNVELVTWGLVWPPQWVQNINTVVVFVGGPLLSALFVRLRARGWTIDVPRQFAVSVLTISLGFLVLPVGIHLAGADGKSAFVWLFISYVLQSIGELLISPVGYAMIGKLAPHKYQGIMMGTWMLVSGLASLISSEFSGMIPEPSGTTAAATNPEYAKLFTWLGFGSLVVGLVLVVLIPWLRTLITDKAPDAPAATPAPAAG
jgi:POT family proton-dependent oligopeptide transporter